jgi:hypothetical protein
MLRVVEESRMSPSFVLNRALYVVDAHVLYQLRTAAPAQAAAPGQAQAPAQAAAPGQAQAEAEAPPARAFTPIFDGAVPPGDHVLQVLLGFQGHGTGVFSYLSGYRFEVRSSHTLRLSPGETVVVTVTAYEKGGITTPLEERPAVSWAESPPY